MHTDTPNHEPGLLMMNSGNMQPIRPSLGSWLTYALGSENQNLPGFVVLCPGQPVVGPQLWSNSFLPGIYQGTHINNRTIDPRTIIRDVKNRYLSPAAQRNQLDLLQEMNAIHLEDRGRDEQLEGRIASLEMAFRMQGEAQEAFDLGRESSAVRAAMATGRSPTPACWPGVWRSAASASSRFTTATTNRGTTTTTSTTTAITPARATNRSPRCCAT